MGFQSMFCGATAVTAMFLLCQPLSAGDPLRVSVCDLSFHPAKFSDRRVIVVGARVVQAIDVSNLFDDTCPDSPIGLRWTLDPEKLKQLQRLRDALVEGGLGGIGREIRGDFIGTFEVAPSSARPTGRITLEAVENLMVKPVPVD